MSLLLQHGYAATTIEAIAAHARVAKKTVYRFASNRDELIGLSVRSWTDPFVPALEHDPSSVEQVIPSLRAVLQLICAQALSTQAVSLYRLLTSAFPGRQELLANYQRNGIERARALLSQWLARQHQRRLLHCPAADDTALLILAMAVAEPLRQAALEYERVSSVETHSAHIERCLRLLDGSTLTLPAHRGSD